MKKTLTEIQTELRQLDKQICAISAALGQLFQDIDAMKEDKSPSDIDFAAIERISRKFMFGEHPLHRLQNGYACRRYIETLLDVVYTDRHSDAVPDRLAFVQWIITQADIDMTLSDLMRSSLDLSADSFGELPGLLTVQYREGLLVDAMLTAYITGSAAAETMQYIAYLAGILEVNEKDLRVLTMIAKRILLQSDKRLGKRESKGIMAKYYRFRHYFGGELLKKQLIAERQVVIEDRGFRKAPRWRVSENCVCVEKGQELAVLYGGYSGMSHTVTAPCAGKFFHFKQNNKHYGVIANPGDDLDSIKGWVKQERG